MRSIALQCSVPGLGLGRNRTAFPRAQARTTTCSSPIQSARVSTPSRATITPSRPGPGSR